MKKVLSLAAVALTLSSCASLTSGQKQMVAIDTTPHDGAKCELSNPEGTWNVTTPGSASVERSYDALAVKCTKGSATGQKLVESKTQGMMAGNLIFGGIIGAGVDAATGAAYEYPQNIHVRMNSKIAKN